MPGREFERELKQALQEYRRGHEKPLLDFFEKYRIPVKDFFQLLVLEASRENMRETMRKRNQLRKIKEEGAHHDKQAIRAC